MTLHSVAYSQQFMTLITPTCALFLLIQEEFFGDSNAILFLAMNILDPAVVDDSICLSTLCPGPLIQNPIESRDKIDP